MTEINLVELKFHIKNMPYHAIPSEYFPQNIDGTILEARIKRMDEYEVTVLFVVVKNAEKIP